MDADAAARPRFRSSVEPVVDADDGLFLLCETGHVWLPGALQAHLAPLLNGQHTVESVFTQLAEQHDPADVLAALDDLRQRRLLAEDTADLPRAERAWWEHCGVSPALAAQRMAESTVAVHAAGDADAGPLRAALARAGLQLAPQPMQAQAQRQGQVQAQAQALQHGDHTPTLTVVVCADPLHPDLARFNALALAQQRPWLLVQAWGLQTWLGPAFVPGQTGCWTCLAQRLRWHRRLDGYLAERHVAAVAQRRHVARNDASARAVFEEAASAVRRWVGTADPGALAGQVLVTDTLSHERSGHPLVRRPQCPDCGTAAAAAPEPGAFVLKPCPKSSARDGGHRATSAVAVAAQLERHVSPITGLVASVTAGERTALPGQQGASRVTTFAADHNFSDMADRRFFLREGLRRRSGGKGQSAAQARTSALAESLERYSGVFDGTEPRQRSSAQALGASALHPNSVLGYSARQYAQRVQANQRDHKAHWVPEPFREDAVIDWTPLWSLTHHRTRHLPTSQCYFGYASQDPLFARADSNGCAAGAVREEAVLQGLLELIERDAVALWWYSRARRPGLDLATCSDPYVADMQAHYRAIQRSLWVLDITSDLGVPTFAALSARTDQPQQDILYGFGAHLDPAVALSRALTEVNQSLDAVPLAGGPPSAQTYRGSHDALQWWRQATVQNQAYLTPSPDNAMRRMSDTADLSTERIDTDVTLLVQRLAAQDIEVLVLEQTRPDVGLPVVRVVAPGLRHFWARFGPGRLYDVPVQQAWIPRPLDETELNPFVVQF
jgi:ribosomal protein S12 methylthiotransferase accessory factor